MEQKKELPSCVYIGTEKFDVEVNSRGELKAFVHQKSGYRLEERRPVVESHKASLQLFLKAMANEDMAKRFPASFQQKGKEIRALIFDKRTPEILTIRERWENIFWSFYNREGRFPVFQGIRREEMLGNYINDVLSILSMKEMKELIAGTEKEDDIAQKTNLVVAYMQRVSANYPRMFRELQQTYFKNRELKSQQFDENGKVKNKFEAIRKAGEEILEMMNAVDRKIAQTSIEKLKKRRGMPESDT